MHRPHQCDGARIFAEYFLLGNLLFEPVDLRTQLVLRLLLIEDMLLMFLDLDPRERGGW